MTEFRLSFFSFAIGMFVASVAIKYESGEIYYGVAFIFYLIDRALYVKERS